MASGNSLTLEVLLRTIDQATAPFKRILASANALKDGLAKTRDAVAKLNAQQASINRFKRLGEEHEALTNKLKSQREKLQGLAQAYYAADNPTKRLTANMERAARAVHQVEEKLGLKQGALNRLGSELKAAGVDTTRLALHERELGSAIAKANQQLEAQRTRLARVNQVQAQAKQWHQNGMKAIGHGAAAVYAGTRAAGAVMGPVKAFAEQEQAATNLKAAMMGADGNIAPEFARINALAIELGNKLPGNTKDFYDMFSMLQRQGMSAQTVLGGLGQATAYLGAGLKMSYTEAAEFAAKLQDATQTSERDMMRLVDTIQRGFYLGVDSNNMLQAYTKLSPAMDTLRVKGIKAAEAFAPLVVMADQAGMKGEQAGNAYRKIFQSVMDTSALQKMNADWKKLKGVDLNLDFTDGNGEFGGLKKMFSELEKLKKFNTADRLSLISGIFGDDAETLQAVTILMSKGEAGYNEVLAKMQRQAALKQRVDSQLGTLSALWEATSGTFVNLLASMGEAIAPQLKQLTEWLGRVTEKAQAFAAAHPQLAAGLMKVAAAGAIGITVFGGLLVVGGTAAMMFANIQRAVTLLTGGGGLGQLLTLGRTLVSGVFGPVSTALRAIVPLIAGVSLPVVAAVAVIAGGALLIYKYWQPIKAFMQGVWQGFTSALAPAVAQLKQALVPLQPMLDWLGQQFAGLGRWISGLLTPFQATNGQLQRATTLGAQLGAVLANTLGGAVRVAAGAINLLAGVFTGSGARIRAGFLQVLQGINQMLGGLPARMIEFGRNAIGGLIRGITGRVGDAVAAVSNVINRVKAAVTGGKGLDIHSPSRVFARYGDYTMQGLAGGLLRSVGSPLAAVSGVTERLRGAGAELALSATLPFAAIAPGYELQQVSVPAPAVRVLPQPAWAASSQQPSVASAIAAAADLLRAVQERSPALELPHVSALPLTAAGGVGAVSAATAPLIAPARAAGQGGAGASGSSGGDTMRTEYHIHLHGVDGGNNQAVVQAVRAELARIDRERATVQRRQLSDAPEY